LVVPGYQSFGVFESLLSLDDAGAGLDTVTGGAAATAR
jgi:hypothetical protein